MTTNPDLDDTDKGAIAVDSGKVGDLLAALKAQLGDDASDVVITNENSYGASVEVAADKAVADDMVVEATSAVSGTVYKWTISVNP